MATTQRVSKKSKRPKMYQLPDDEMFLLGDFDVTRRLFVPEKNFQFWAEEAAKHKNCILVMPMLAKHDWFHRDVLQTADAYLFPRGRFVVDTGDGGQRGTGRGYVIAAYGLNNVLAIKKLCVTNKYSMAYKAILPKAS